MSEKAATVQPIIGRDGKLLGVTLNGVTCVRPENVEWDTWAESLLVRVLTLPRDSVSPNAVALIEADGKRLNELYQAIKWTEE